MIRRSEPGVRRWQEEVARDPGSPAFVPLADLYRVQGRLDAARRVCVRGLERQPNHVEGHYLLGRIYRDGEDSEKAFDEWEIALRLDPLHTAARRAIAFHCLEQGEYRSAELHFRQALDNDPDDPRLRRALRFLERGAAQPLGSEYWDGVTEIVEPWARSFAHASRARLVIALDSSGHILAQHGFSRDLDLAAFASLAAGVHVASCEIARMLRQDGFSQLYQGRGDRQIFLGAIAIPAGELLLLVVFDEGTTIGLVRAIFRETVAELKNATWPVPASTRPFASLEAKLAAGLSRAASDGDPR